MKIIITENQFNQLSEQNLREFLYKFWDSQKKQGEKPSLDDIIYQISEIEKGTKDDDELIRPIWYEYNGGYQKLLERLKSEIVDKEFYMEGDHNLKLEFKVMDVITYGENINGGVVDIDCQLLGGTVDGYKLNTKTEEMEPVPNMTLQDQLAELEYDTDDFISFLRREIIIFLEDKFERFGIPFFVELS